jgi:hypothetical protein
MFFLARVVILFASGWVWRATRRVEWVVRRFPWMPVLTFLVTVLSLVSLILEIVIRVRSF